MKSELNRNYSEVTEFILLGFRTSPEVQIFLFFLFLLIYMVIVLRNLSMLVVIEIDSRLDTPVYFFSQKFVLFGSPLLHSHCFQNWLLYFSRKRKFLTMFVQHSCFSLLSLLGLKVFFWLWWHMIASQLFVHLSSILYVCLSKLVFVWWLAPLSVDASTPWYKQVLPSVCISVEKTD